VNLTPEQRDKVVEYLEGPCQLREAADMLQVSWPAFAEDYSLGMADAEAGRGSEAGSWYLSCRAARSRTRAKLRAEAHATVGSRESADLLALLARLEAEAEPMPSSHDDPRASAPLSLVDALNDPALSPDERERLQGLHKNFHEAGMFLGGSDADMDRQLKEREELRLKTLSVNYLIENKGTTNADTVRELSTGIRSIDGVESHTFESCFVQILGPGEKVEVTGMEVPWEMHGGMTEANRAEGFTYWADFRDAKNRRWEASYNARARRLDYRRL